MKQPILTKETLSQFRDSVTYSSRAGKVRLEWWHIDGRDVYFIDGQQVPAIEYEATHVSLRAQAGLS